MNIRRMYLFAFLTSLYFMSGVLVPFFTDWGGITFTQIMILQAWFAFAIFILEIPTGALGDYIGRKYSLSLSSVCLGIAALVYSSVPNFLVFLLGETLWALSIAFMSGSEEALIYDSLKEAGREKKYKYVIGRINSLELLGIMVSAPIGSVMASIYGLRSAVMFMVFPALAALIITLTLREPKRYREDKKSYIEIIQHGFRYFRKHRVLRILSADYVFVAAISFFFIWIYQPVLMSLSVPLIYFGLVHAGMTISQIIFLNAFPVLEKRLGSKRNYLLISTVVPAFCFLGMGLIKDPLMAVFFIILGSGLGLSRETAYSGYMNPHISSKNRATVLSAVSMFNMFSRTMIYPVIGLFVEYSLDGALLFLSAVLFFSAALSKVEEYMLAGKIPKD